MNANGRRKFPGSSPVPHENVAMAMAHGYYRIAQKPAAVMVHVTVGTGNTVNGLIERHARQYSDPARRRPHADY